MNLRGILLVALGTAILFAVSSCTPTVPSAKGLHYAPNLPGDKVMMKQTLDMYYAHPNHFFPIPPPEMTDRSKLEIQPPIARYILGAADVVAGHGVETAKLDSYIYYIKVSGDYVGIIDSACGDGTFQIRGKNGQMFTLNGDFVDVSREYLVKTARDLAQVEGLEQLRHDSYELRFLDLPPLGRTALHSSLTGIAEPGYVVTDSVIWLKCGTPGGDLIYTWPGDSLIKDWTGLKPGTVYPASEVLKAIQPAVKAFFDSEGKAAKDP